MSDNGAIAAYLNELSCECGSASSDNAEEHYVALARLMSALRAKSSNFSLATPQPIRELSVGGVYFVEWGVESCNRDYFRAIHGALNRAPFVVPQSASHLVEYHHNGVGCLGLGIAHSKSGVAFSFPTDSMWKISSITIDRYIVAVDDEQVDQVETPNIFDMPSAFEYLQLVADRQESSPATLTGQQIWNMREEHFPKLRFLPRTERDLVSLEGRRLAAVHERLVELNSAVEEWDPSTDPFPAWRSFVTPEAATRKQLCWFVDRENRQLFDLHARFTPGAGRIHFRVDPSAGALIVAYIGSKL